MYFIGKIFEYPVKLVLFVIGFLWFFNPFRAMTGLHEGDEYDFRGRRLETHEGSAHIENMKQSWIVSVIVYGAIGSLIMWGLHDWESRKFWQSVIVGGGFFATWITLGFSVACSNFKWTEDIDIWKNSDKERAQGRR